VCPWFWNAQMRLVIERLSSCCNFTVPSLCFRRLFSDPNVPFHDLLCAR